MADADLREELDECLEILGSFADEATVLETYELQTACWQIVELVTLLLDDNDSAWASVTLLRELTNKLQQELKEKEGIWTPARGRRKH